MGGLLLRDVLIIFLVAVPFIVLVHRLRLPALIGFLLTGALIGPHGIRWVEDARRIEILAEIGVTLLLFTIGLEFSLAAFTKLKTYVVKGGLLQIAGTVAAGIAVGWAMRWPVQQGVFFGCVIALSSTAVVLSALMNERMHESLPGRIGTGILILQDLAVIPMVALLPSLGPSESGDFWTHTLLHLGQIAALFALTFVAIRYLAGGILRTISKTRSRELFLITVIVFALGMAWITHQMTLSFALGAFLGGLMVGSTDFQGEALAEVSPFRYCFNSLFFVSIGMLLDFEFLRLHLATIGLLVVLIPTLKWAITTGSLLLLRAPLRISANVGILLGQIGEFSFLLATLGRTANVIDFTLYQYIVATAVATMFATPLMVKWSLPLSERIARMRGFKKLGSSTEVSSLEEAVSAMKDHVIVCGFGPLGETLGRILDDYKIPHVILELNPETIERTKTAKRNIFFGDGASQDILYKSGIERAKMLAITIPDYFNNVATIRQARRLSEGISIIARAKYRKEVQDLYEAGADIVVSEELEGGIEMGRYALKELGIQQAEVDDYVRKVREFGSADFF